MVGWLIVFGYLTAQCLKAGADAGSAGWALGFLVFALVFAILGLSGAYYIVVHSE